MSRSGYGNYDDDGNYPVALWRGAVESAIRGRRGQAFLRELLAALDALPEKRLIANDLVSDGEVCAIGAVGVARGVEMADLDPEDYETVADRFGIARALAQELFWLNDEAAYAAEAPEARYARVRRWVEEQIR